MSYQTSDYGKSHYSRLPECSLSSKSIIESSVSPRHGGDPGSGSSAQGGHDYPAGSPPHSSRTSHNYERDTAASNAKHSTDHNDDAESAGRAAGADDDDKQLEKKLFHVRKKSWNREDQKRVQYEFMMTPKTADRPDGFTEI
ncbi:hypothetical protein RUND412_001715 [Rhizina undulata]